VRVNGRPTLDLQLVLTHQDAGRRPSRRCATGCWNCKSSAIASEGSGRESDHGHQEDKRSKSRQRTSQPAEAGNSTARVRRELPTRDQEVRAAQAKRLLNEEEIAPLLIEEYERES